MASRKRLSISSDVKTLLRSSDKFTDELDEASAKKLSAQNVLRVFALSLMSAIIAAVAFGLTNKSEDMLSAIPTPFLLIFGALIAIDVIGVLVGGGMYMRHRARHKALLAKHVHVHHRSKELPNKQESKPTGQSW